MKYTLIAVAVASTAALSCFAQDMNAPKTNPSGIYILGGYNNAGITTPNNSLIQSAKTINTFNTGVLADIRLSDRFSLATGVFICGNGAQTGTTTKINDTTTAEQTTKFSPLYLQVPLMLAFKIPISEDMRFYIAAGPYVARGVAGKAKRELTINGDKKSLSRDIKFANRPVLLRSDDGLVFAQVNKYYYGINGQMGIQFSKFLVGVNYAYGFTPIADVIKQEREENTNRYATLSLSIGIKL